MCTVRTCGYLPSNLPAPLSTLFDFPPTSSSISLFYKGSGSTHPSSGVWVLGPPGPRAEYFSLWLVGRPRPSASAHAFPRRLLHFLGLQTSYKVLLRTVYDFLSALSVPPGCFPQRPGFDRLCGTPGWVTAKGPDPAFCKGYQDTARRVKLSQCGGFHIYSASYQTTRSHFQETLEFWIREPVAVTSWQNGCHASRAAAF